jgi:hypothetical protein
MRNLLVLTSLLLVSGCTSISTKETISFANPSKGFNSIYIIFDDVVIKDYPIREGKTDMATVVAKAMKQITVNMAEIWPEKFSAQGIKAEVTTTSIQPRIPYFSIALIAAPKASLDYELLITLVSVSPGWLGMYGVNFEATLRDRKNRTGDILWKASIELHKGLGPINERVLSEKLADELIFQLKKRQIQNERQQNNSPR